MSRTPTLRVLTPLVAVLMFFQYGLMPLLHAQAHLEHDTKQTHGSALSEDQCAFAKVAETTVALTALDGHFFWVPIQVSEQPSESLVAAVPPALLATDSRAPPSSA